MKRVTPFANHFSLRGHGGISPFIDESLDFSANVNPLGFPLAVQSVFNDIEKWVRTYPDIDCSYLRESLAKQLDLSPDSILFGNGSMELIYLLPRLFSKPVAFQWAPTFLGYEGGVVAAKGKMISESLEKRGSSWHLPEKIVFSEEAQLIFLSNPNNPTGNLISMETLLTLADQCEKEKRLLILDEAFLDFARPSQTHSFLKHVKKYRWVGVLRSFTKIFALPGIRLGYLVGHPDWISQLRYLQPPWSVNGIAQAVAQKLLNQESFLTDSREEVGAFRQDFVESLKKIHSLKVYDSFANYLFIELVDKKVSELESFLNENEIQIRNCSNFRCLEEDKYFRLAVRNPNENKKILFALNEFFK